MKTPLSWISLYTPLDSLLSQNKISELAHIYSTHTAEIDDIIPHTIDGIVVGKVLSCERHPESKKLRIVKVNIGSETSTILTGAANVDDATYVPVATVGTVFGEDFTITPRKMAGMMSHGMICADDELGLVSERSGWIMILEEYWNEDLLETKIGSNFFDLKAPFIGINGEKSEIPIKDTTFEIDNKFITNRPDLFSVVGNAREWQTVFDLEMKGSLPEKSTTLIENLPSKKIHIESDKCMAYYALETEQNTPSESPLAIKILMHRSGLTSKNSIVDISNMILTEYGQPMHTFDADKIQGNITVRMANNSEEMLALNGETYNLSIQDLIIADETGPIAIAGIIGGDRTAVSDTTTHTLWESATFDATTVRLTAQRINLRTDASTRYEKSLDPLLAGKTFQRVKNYLDFCDVNAKFLGQSNYLNTDALREISIEVEWDFVNKKIWIEVPQEKSKSILQPLGFEIISEDKEKFKVKVPSWRATKDVDLREDIVEEIVRIYGYEAVPRIPIPNCQPINEKNNQKLLKNTLLDFFSTKGWNESLNYSFTNENLEKKCRWNLDNAVKVKNACTADYTHMRTRLSTRLLGNIASNLRHTNELKFFEIANVYAKSGDLRPEIKNLIDENTPLQYSEKTMVAGITTDENILNLRGDLETLFKKVIGFIPLVHQKEDTLPFLHPGLSGAYDMGDIQIASFGQIHPKVLQEFDIEVPLAYFEIDFSVLLQLTSDRDNRFNEISSYQALTREFNFVLPEKTHTGDIARDILSVHPWIYDVYIDSIFRDDTKVGKNLKSVNFAFTLQSMRQTISDDEAGEVSTQVIEMMKEKWYELRA